MEYVNNLIKDLLDLRCAHLHKYTKEQAKDIVDALKELNTEASYYKCKCGAYHIDI